MTELSVLALQNAAILRELNRHEPPESIAELGRAFDRDKDNMRKTVLLLREAGYVAADTLTLTEEGRDQLDAIGRAQHGRKDMLPKGWLFLAHNEITPDPNNPRTAFDADDLDALAASIASRGLLQNLVVWADGRLRAGERRWRAIGLLIPRGEWAPDRKLLCRVSEGGELEALQDALVENLQRSDLNPMDEAEAYLKLEDGGMSTDQIGKQVGRRGQRSVQQYIMVARKASPAQKAQVRSGERGINQVLGELQEHAKPKPALLNPRLTLALVEVAQFCAETQDAAQFGQPGWARLPQAPTNLNGVLQDLSARKLITLRPGDGSVWAKVMAASTEAGEYLASVGFDADPGAVIDRFRAAVMGGEIFAAQLRAQGRWHTRELNRPDVETRTAFAASEPGAPPTAAPALALAPAKPEMTARQRMVLVEVAHKIGAGTIEARSGAPAAEVLHDFSSDPACSALIIDHRVLAFTPGPRGDLVVSLTDTGRAWFNDQGYPAGPRGPGITDGDLYDAHVAVYGQDIEGVAYGQDMEGVAYATDWLLDREPEPERVNLHAGEPLIARMAPAPTAAEAPTFQSSIGRAAIRVSAEARVLQRMQSALTEAERLITKAKSKKLDGAEADQVLALIHGAYDAATPLLTEAA